MSGAEQKPVVADAKPVGGLMAQRRGWQADLFSCFGQCPGIFCFSACLPCIGYARSAGRSGTFPFQQVLLGTLAVWLLIMLVEFVLDWLSTSGDLHPMFLNIPDLILVGLVVFSYILRTKIVQKYNTGESQCTSCLLVCFCGPCALGQQMQHIDLEESGAIDNGCHFNEKPPATAV